MREEGPCARATFTRRRVIASVGLAAIAIASRVNGRPGAATEETKWTTGVPIPLARSELAAAVIDGTIYVAGGFGGGSRVDRFDPDLRAWEQLPDVPGPVHHPGIASLEGRLYVVGGYSERDHSALDAVWCFDPSTGAWESRASLPVAKGALGLATVEGALFAIGGALKHLNGPVSGEVLRFDPRAGTWEERSPMPTPREHLAVASTGGMIFAIGGRANGHESTDIASANERYDPVTDTWTKLEPLPVPRGGLSGVAVGETVIVLGGERGTTLYADANLYDPATNAWRALPPIPTARHGLASAVVDNVIYAIAGSTLAGRVENTAVVETLTVSEEATQVA